MDAWRNGEKGQKQKFILFVWNLVKSEIFGYKVFEIRVEISMDLILYICIKEKPNFCPFSFKNSTVEDQVLLVF